MSSEKLYVYVCVCVCVCVCVFRKEEDRLSGKKYVASSPSGPVPAAAKHKGKQAAPMPEPSAPPAPPEPSAPPADNADATIPGEELMAAATCGNDDQAQRTAAGKSGAKFPDLKSPQEIAGVKGQDGKKPSKKNVWKRF